MKESNEKISSCSSCSIDDDVFEEEKMSPVAKTTSDDVYTLRYRVLKTVLMILAWMSFGLNVELTGTTMEDLKILLNVNYQHITFAIMIRSVGYITMTLITGLIMDRFLDYSECVMAIAKLFLIIPNFFIPWMKIYGATISLFLMQGLSQGLYDVCGNQIILRLWNGISNSPISAMHAGYGIGAILSVQIVKPFISFNKEAHHFENHTVNDTRNQHLKASDIRLQIPYSFSAVFGSLLVGLFLVAQYFESKNRRNLKSRQTITTLKHVKDSNIGHNVSVCPKVQKILFSKVYVKPIFIYKLVQLMLLIFLCVSTSGLVSTITAFLLTYLTKGPSNLTIENSFLIQSLYWIFFVLSRFLAAVLAFKMNALVFFCGLLLINITLLVLFLIPYFNKIQLFYWFIICALGLSTGPTIPSLFMIAKHILKEVNSFTISLFCLGLGSGTILSQLTTGVLLDEFKPTAEWFGYENPTSVYILPLYLLTWISICSLFYSVILFIHHSFSHFLTDSEPQREITIY